MEVKHSTVERCDPLTQDSIQTDPVRSCSTSHMMGDCSQPTFPGGGNFTSFLSANDTIE